MITSARTMATLLGLWMLVGCVSTDPCPEPEGAQTPCPEGCWSVSGWRVDEERSCWIGERLSCEDADYSVPTSSCWMNSETGFRYHTGSTVFLDSPWVPCDEPVVFDDLPECTD